MLKYKDLEEFFLKQSIYERACNFSEKILPVKPWKALYEKYDEAIQFSHLKITPKGAFSLPILFIILSISLPLTIMLITNFFSLTVFMLVLIISSIFFYYLYDYPFYYSVLFRIKASSEIVLSVVYMTISMRAIPNIENAVEFTARNLSGPLGVDLKQLLWDVYTRKYNSIPEALDSFIKKWRKENEEFAESLYLIKNSMAEDPLKRERMLNEAVSYVLSRTKERMKNYSQSLKTPITVINALGILLPILGLTFFPIIALFMPETIQPIFLILGYNIILPIIVFWLMRIYLGKRPYTFHQPDISKHPKYKKEKILSKSLFISFLISLPICSFGLFMMLNSKEIFSFDLLIYSLTITLGICAGLVSYFLLSSIFKIGIRNEICQIENEFSEALFHLGNQLTRGIPLEAALSSVTLNIRMMKISKFFEKILYNIKTFGMTLEQAVFDEHAGAMKEYPSTLIEAVMTAIVEISKKGMEIASEAMITISDYLKDIHTVEEDLKDMLSEVTSSMQLQAILLAPISSGIVVSLAAMITQLLFNLKVSMEKIYGKLAEYGPIGSAGSGILTSLINLDKIILPQHFQIIVSVYMIEIVSIIAIFVSRINNGEEDILRRIGLGKTLILAITIYSFVLVLTFSMFSAIIPIMGLST